MFETSKISAAWVRTINRIFDAVIVPDQYLVKVYENSGVRKPIFVLPLGIYLDDFLRYKIKKKENNKFVFGCMANYDLRKNQMLLIQAFVQEFGNSKDVILKINGRSFDCANIHQYIKNQRYLNVYLSKENLSWQKYIEFMSTLDCYVNISKGEGFSIPPREALALKIPCILTNNTAQKTICNTGFVKSIDCDIFEQAKFSSDLFDPSEDLGFFFNCKLQDVRKALREVYENYKEYKKKAKLGKEWVKQYRWQNLKDRYHNLFKPKKIILGNHNEVTENHLITNSKKLYNKYLSLQKN
jgi:glycosyltransferase involved in cell wall biosynthesis